MGAMVRRVLPAWGLTAVLVLAATVACGRSGCGDSGLGSAHERTDTVEQLGERAVAALVNNNEAAFVRLHVQEGDTTPNGEFMIAAGSGKPLPDAAWTARVRAAFGKARTDLTQITGGPVNLSFAGVRDVQMRDDGELGGWFYKLRVNVHTPDKSLVLTFMNGMKSQRGWVVTDDPAVVIEAM